MLFRKLSQTDTPLLNAIEYYPDGRLESFDFSGASEQKARVVVPESIMEALLEAVCLASASQ